MSKDSDDIQEEGYWRSALATNYLLQNKLTNAKESFMKAVDIFKVTGDRAQQADVYFKLAALNFIIGDFRSEKEYLDEWLRLIKETGDKKGEANCYSLLGHYFLSVNDNRKANEYFQKAHKIRMEIGGRREFSADCEDQAAFYSHLGDHQKALEYLKESFAITSESYDRHDTDVVEVPVRLGIELFHVGRYTEAEKYFEKVDSLLSGYGLAFNQCNLFFLTRVKFSLSKTQDAHSRLLQCIQSFERLRNLIKTNEHFSISLLEREQLYKHFSVELFHAGSPHEALSAEELGRARALEDLIAAKYPDGVKNISLISADLQSLCRIEKLINRETNCTYLYLSYYERRVRVAILKPGGDTYFSKEEEVDIPTLMAEDVVDLDDLFNKTFRSFGVLPRELCEDRSLDDIDKHDDSLAQRNETEDTDSNEDPTC